MGGKGGKAKTEGMVRFAPYVEDQHKDFLATVKRKRDFLLDTSPFANTESLKTEEIFWGLGFSLTGFTTLYDNWAFQMWGMDVNVAYTDIFRDMMGGSMIGELVAAEGKLVEDDIITSSYPRFETGMRDINSVMSSSFLIGRALIEDTRVKVMAKFSAELKFRLMPMVVERWSRQLEWRKSVIATEIELMRFYLQASMDRIQHDQEVSVKHALWPFTVLEYERAALGALTGATKTTTTAQGGGGGVMKALVGAGSGALGGAGAGAMIGAAGGPIGAMGGAVIGGIMGLAGGMSG